MNDGTQQTPSLKQDGFEDAHLREPPTLLGSASRLAESVHRGLDRDLAERIIRQSTNRNFFWQADVRCSAYPEWVLHWCERNEPAQQIATGPGQRELTELDTDLFEDSAAFLQIVLAKVSPRERALVHRLVDDSSAAIHVTAAFGQAHPWRLASTLQVFTGRAEGWYSIGPSLQAEPPAPA